MLQLHPYMAYFDFYDAEYDTLNGVLNGTPEVR